MGKATEYCVECKDEFSSVNPAANHFLKSRCGACGGLVGDGCFEEGTNNRGEVVKLCNSCLDEGREATHADTILGRQAGSAAAGVAEELEQKGEALIDAATSKLDASVLEAEAAVKRVLEDAEQKIDRQRRKLRDDATALLDQQRKSLLADAEQRGARLLDKAEEQLRGVIDESLDDGAKRLTSWRDEAEAKLNELTSRKIQEAKDAGEKLVEAGRSSANEWVVDSLAKLDRSMEKRAKLEVRNYLILMLLLTSAAALSGAISLAFASLHAQAR